MSTETAKVTAIKDLWQMKQEGAISMAEFKKEKDAVMSMKAVQPVQQHAAPVAAAESAASAPSAASTFVPKTLTQNNNSGGGPTKVVESSEPKFDTYTTWYGMPATKPHIPASKMESYTTWYGASGTREKVDPTKEAPIPWYEPAPVATGIKFAKDHTPSCVVS